MVPGGGPLGASTKVAEGVLLFAAGDPRRAAESNDDRENCPSASMALVLTV